MTSLPIVPSKFYQVCRLCLTIVSDTNDLLNLSVFGTHNAACIANTTATNSTIVDDCKSPAVNASSNNNSTNTGGSGSSSNVGVIVKTNRKYSTPTSEHKNTLASNNASDNEAIAAAAAAADASGRDSGNDGKTTAAAESSRGNNPGDDDNNNFKIDGDLQQSDVLERIHTFLSITVSGRIFYPSFAQFFFLFSFSSTFHLQLRSMCTNCVTFIEGIFVLMLARILGILIVITTIGRMYPRDKAQ